MTVHRLLLTDPGRTLGVTDHYWSDSPDASFVTNLSASLAEFPNGRRANRDLIRLAVGVFLTDRTQSRPKGWARDLELHVPMERPTIWKPCIPALQQLLAFLTGDRWTLHLTSAKRPDSPSVLGEMCPRRDEYMLLSGGADSFTGALLLAGADTTCLISHTAVGQKDVRAALRDVWGVKPTQFTRRVQRKQWAADNQRFGDERTSRSRSLLFIAIGLLASSGNKAPLLIPENGFASLNPPLAPERTGSLSTRTTHPWFFYELRRILDQVGAHGELSNPFDGLTKGEMFALVAERYGVDRAAQLLRVSYSCSRTNIKFISQGVRHCGVCFGCIVRRAAFAASKVPDRTDYLADVNDQLGAANGWLTSGQRQDVVVAAYAVAKGTIDAADILATGLPPTVGIDAAIDLAQRGLNEIKLLF